jgi:hypothetical protein
MLRMARTCRGIVSLSIKGCKEITAASIAEFPMRCHAFFKEGRGWETPGLGHVSLALGFSDSEFALWGA